VYGPAQERVAAIAQAFRTIKLLETVANFAAERYVWPRPITLEMSTCGQPSAYWDTDEHKLVVCYELGQDFVMLFRDFGLTAANALEQKKK